MTRRGPEKKGEGPKRTRLGVGDREEWGVEREERERKREKKQKRSSQVGVDSKAVSPRRMSRSRRPTTNYF